MHSVPPVHPAPTHLSCHTAGSLPAALGRLANLNKMDLSNNLLDGMDVVLLLVVSGLVSLSLVSLLVSTVNRGSRGWKR